MVRERRNAEAQMVMHMLSTHESDVDECYDLVMVMLPNPAQCYIL